MKKLLTLAIAATAISFGAANAQAKPGNCAIWLEEAAKTVDADIRFDGALETEVVGALNTFAKAQRKIMNDGMAQTYADSKAYGWDKAKVDEMMAQNETAMRKGFRTSTMEADKLYMDHLIAVNNCIESNPNDSQYGMSRADFISTLEKTVPIVRGG
jgi:hypothetical protein